MGRLAWWQARFRRVRALALLAGMLVAVTAFTVLTACVPDLAAAHRRHGDRALPWTAYDILVRPKGSRTELESQTGTVQP